ncbi:hypothetical protein [Chlamydia vaughanii]|uniref:hypothetical protein n=1 Tax=Chlamydia vaughanii TaxID=3112552 RepID=UPI0032B2E59F
MSFVANVKEVYGGLGRVDFSQEAIPGFSKHRVCSSVSKTVLAILVAVVAIAALIMGCVACSTGGLAIITGLATIALAGIGLAWSIIVMKRLFEKRGTAGVVEEAATAQQAVEVGSRSRAGSVQSVSDS